MTNVQAAEGKKIPLTEEEFQFLVDIPLAMQEVSAEPNTYEDRKKISEKGAELVRNSLLDDSLARQYEEIAERMAQEFRYAKGAFETGRYYQLLIRIRDENDHLAGIDIPNDDRVVAGFNFD